MFTPLYSITLSNYYHKRQNHNYCFYKTSLPPWHSLRLTLDLFALPRTIKTQSDSHHSLLTDETEVFCRGNDAEGVGVTHTSLPALHNHYGLALRENLELKSLEIYG